MSMYSTLQSQLSRGSEHKKMNTCTKFYKQQNKIGQKRGCNRYWCDLMGSEKKKYKFLSCFIFITKWQKITFQYFLAERRFFITFTQESIKIICHYSDTITRQDWWYTDFFFPVFSVVKRCPNSCCYCCFASFEISNAHSQRWWQ